jgi:anchored repeat ABC transporter substrate-binding protein
LNWVFTAPGRYELTFAANPADSGAVGQAEGTFVFDVGSPGTADGRTRIATGHADIAVGMSGGRIERLYVRSDAHGTTPPGQVILDALPQTKTSVTSDPRYAFLGSGEVWVLPQAVIGRHVHGDVDPHIWLDPVNVKAYVRLIRDTFSQLDPEGAPTYAANAERYIGALGKLESEMDGTLQALRLEDKKLVTTHDAFGYLAERWGFDVVGFVVPSPVQQPSASQTAALHDQIRRSAVKAVFIEPQLEEVSRVLKSVATDLGVKVCQLYSDAFDNKVKSYEDVMRHNARELVRCLG